LFRLERIWVTNAGKETSKARTQRRPADRENAEFVGPSDSRTKHSVAVDDLLQSKQPEDTDLSSSSRLHLVGTYVTSRDDVTLTVNPLTPTVAKYVQL